MIKKKQRKIVYKKLNINKKYIIMVLVGLLLSLFINIWPIIFLSIFCVANAFLLSIDRYVSAPVDLEFSTFSAILMTKAYSLKWGIAVGILTKIAGIIYNKKFSVDHLFMMGGYIIAAFMASIIPGNNIMWIGILATIVVNIYIVFVSKFITMLSNYETLMYGGSNTIFNIVLFIGFSPAIYWLMNLLN